MTWTGSGTPSGRLCAFPGSLADVARTLDYETSFIPGREDAKEDFKAVSQRPGDSGPRPRGLPRWRVITY